jgi:hypothetical protein
MFYKLAYTSGLYTLAWYVKSTPEMVVCFNFQPLIKSLDPSALGRPQSKRKLDSRVPRDWFVYKNTGIQNITEQTGTIGNSSRNFGLVHVGFDGVHLTHFLTPCSFFKVSRIRTSISKYIKNFQVCTRLK